jgi:hypothetical protein
MDELIAQLELPSMNLSPQQIVAAIQNPEVGDFQMNVGDAGPQINGGVAHGWTRAESP